jgi:glycosyltransferase involved in cell wall biosynthesis
VPLRNRPLRILELRTVRGTGGGPEKTILLGTARTDPARYAITVCYIRDDRDSVFLVDERAQSLPVKYVEVRERHSLDPGIWPRLKALARDEHIDIVHAHDYKTDLLAWLLGRRLGIVPLATAHGWTGHSTRERMLYYPGDRWVLARLPHVIAVSTDIRNQLVRAGAKPANVTVVLNAIDASAFRRDKTREANARHQFGLSSSDFVIGAVGRLEPQKDFHLLISAFASLRQTVPAARLVIAGDGSLRASLQAHIEKLGLQDRCRLLGHVDDVALLHHAFDLFVQSSNYEGTPNAVLEAMALESPIVATDAGGTAEIARHGVEALIVPFEDEPALAAALAQAIGDSEGTAARARAARRRVEGELSFDSRLRKVEAIYDRLAETSPIRLAAPPQPQEPQRRRR